MLLHHTAKKVVEISKRCILIYIYFQFFLLFSFISATGDSQEETEIMEPDVYQEKCLRPLPVNLIQICLNLVVMQPVRITAKMFHIIPWIIAF